MSNCNIALNASINLKEQPNGLYVHGSIMVYTSETKVYIAKAEPQGINPKVLLLNLTVNENPGPMKGIQRPFFYEEHGDVVNEYTQVQVVANIGDDCTVDIEMFG